MHIDTLKTIGVLILILLAFAFAGRGDYQEALEQENARLKGAIHVCQTAASLRQVQP